MRHLNLLASMAALALAASAAASAEAGTLNKCIDARGKVTYSNLPCRNSRETRAVEIDPAPLPDPVRSAPVQVQASPAPARLAAPAKPAAPGEPATLQLDTRRAPAQPAARPPARQCDTLSDQLGRVFDKMDAARRKGYTQQQMDAWNQEIKDLDRKKQQSGCF